ncbi:interleukin-15 receptor subunit alpha isoform C [Alligator mississippiensis]|uniref:Interleukin-15 receptor subunit alpha isoform B n=1 Tax=Alligator mississippiensis TaxID=8496 RepID=A0A151NPT9_ALLMI|nr:interleukin-15 receptor subunit alpha isoform B [Alligator mississippiensis]KYO38841.1 interleukin-15 receptor subunit alpha isoform C [Alligator mississippiensis]
MPKEVENAEIHVGTNNVLNAMLRYTCKEGYKRKAGTSTLIKCEQKDNQLHWTESNLKCIRDPALPPSTPSPKPTTSAPIPEETSPTSQVTPEITTDPGMASTPSRGRETTSPLAGPTSQPTADMSSLETLVTTATAIGSTQVSTNPTTEGMTQPSTTASQDTHTSWGGTNQPSPDTFTTDGDKSAAASVSLTTEEQTQLPTAATPNTEGFTQVMISSTVFPLVLLIAAVGLYCAWKKQICRRHQFAFRQEDIPLKGRREEVTGEPEGKNTVQIKRTERWR